MQRIFSVPPPQWENLGGDVSYTEQGVFSNLGNYPTSGGPQKMKMVGIMPGWLGGNDEGDAPSIGFNPYAGGAPVYEGKKGLVQCGINASTGETMTDASGNARCWQMPVVAGSTGVVGQGGGMGAWVNPSSDLQHYNAGGIGAIIVIPVGISLLMAIALMAYSIWVTKRVNKKDEPGIIAKLLRWDTWKLWGNKYSKKTHTFFAPEGGKEDWLAEILSNDEASTDEELVKHFITEGGLTESEAKEWVAKRPDYMLGLKAPEAYGAPVKNVSDFLSEARSKNKNILTKYATGKTSIRSPDNKNLIWNMKSVKASEVADHSEGYLKLVFEGDATNWVEYSLTEDAITKFDAPKNHNQPSYTASNGKAECGHTHKSYDEAKKCGMKKFGDITAPDGTPTEFEIKLKYDADSGDASFRSGA